VAGEPRQQIRCLLRWATTAVPTPDDIGRSFLTQLAMKLAYAKPAHDEGYLISRNEARRIVHAHDPDLELLSFQTMHGPKMSRDIPYLATCSWSYIRVFSIRPVFDCEDLRLQFRTQVLPHIAAESRRIRARVVRWPQVIVALDGEIHQVSCSEGWLFPSLDEVVTQIKHNPHALCRYAPLDESTAKQK
jgi:hypothetical protein